MCPADEYATSFNPARHVIFPSNRERKTTHFEIARMMKVVCGYLSPTGVAVNTVSVKKV